MPTCPLYKMAPTWGSALQGNGPCPIASTAQPEHRAGFGATTTTKNAIKNKTKQNMTSNGTVPVGWECHCNRPPSLQDGSPSPGAQGSARRFLFMEEHPYSHHPPNASWEHAGPRNNSSSLWFQPLRSLWQWQPPAPPQPLGTVPLSQGSPPGEADTHPVVCTAGNGDSDPGAAPAPFPQRGSQAETLNPDKPV